METIKCKIGNFLKLDNGNGSGYGYGSGYGNGSGYDSGNGYIKYINDNKTTETILCRNRE